MPTYEYLCNKCGKTHDVFQSITARPISRCPDKKCGGRVKRLLGSGAGFIFRGSGFYITDYRSKGYQEAKKKEESSKSSEPPKPKSDAKQPKTSASEDK